MLLPAGVSSVFSTCSNSPDLSVGMSVYDLSTGTAVLVQGPTLMENFVGSAYQASFTPLAGKKYVVFMAVYTGEDLETIDDGYDQDTQEVTAMTLVLPAQSVIGLVDEAPPCAGGSPTFSIYRGDAKTMYLKAINGGCSTDPLDLSSCTEIVVNLPNADGTITKLNLTNEEVAITAPAVLGKFSVPISDDVSELLNVGVFQNVDVTFTIAGEVFTVPFLQALSVFETV